MLVGLMVMTQLVCVKITVVMINSNVKLVGLYSKDISVLKMNGIILKISMPSVTILKVHLSLLEVVPTQKLPIITHKPILMITLVNMLKFQVVWITMLKTITQKLMLMMDLVPMVTGVNLSTKDVSMLNMKSTKSKKVNITVSGKVPPTLKSL